jgi:hypothetical protein
LLPSLRWITHSVSREPRYAHGVPSSSYIHIPADVSAGNKQNDSSKDKGKGKGRGININSNGSRVICVNQQGRLKSWDVDTQLLSQRYLFVPPPPPLPLPDPYALPHQQSPLNPWLVPPAAPVIAIGTGGRPRYVCMTNHTRSS